LLSKNAFGEITTDKGKQTTRTDKWNDVFLVHICIYLFAGPSASLFVTDEHCLNKSGDLYVAFIPIAPFYVYFVYLNITAYLNAEVHKYKSIFA
jgi:hypothetical protein